MEAMNIARPRESITTAVSRSDMPAKVKTALRTLLLSTSDVPGTEGRKTALRFDGHGNNILFGASTFFNTPNFADTYSPLILQLHEGPGKHSHLRIRSAAQPAVSDVPPEIIRAEPKMPSLERMHQIGAKDPRAQAKFFILMTELHYRFIIGLDRLHIGRLTLAQPRVPVHDEVAASLQPCVAPGTIDVQAPFEAQGRGFEHGHGKGHGIVGSTMKWLRKSVVAGLETAAQKLRQTMLSLAETVQYESARESATQMEVHDLPPEPFTMEQQRQTRMDGGEDEDGSLREYVPIGPAVVQPHIEREHDRATAENRLPLIGSAAYRDLPLTGAFQSTFPWYRQRFAFASLGGATQPTAGYLPYRSDAKLFSIDEDGKVLAVLKPDGTDANQEDLESDAAAWASHFGHDSFNNHCTNHEHNCTETCVKYVKQKLEAKLSLRSNKVPSCRFWYFRVKKLKLKRVRRRGKPLVSSPHVEETDDRNQQFRCQLKRGHPLRSTSNDVCQVSDRCNVDYQFLGCAPVQCSDENDAPQLVPSDVAPQRKRLTKKTKDITKRRHPTYRTKGGVKWLYGCDTKKFNAKLLLSFSAAFRKAYAMDFYITKYQGKMMESLTPLFQTMTTGIQRLEQQEKEEAEKSRLALEDSIPQGEAKKRKTQTEEAARARRVCVRLASMANRCYWLSTTEVTTHILTGGDALQSHHNQRMFTRQLQWAMQQCKRILNKEAPIEDVAQSQQSIQTARVQLRMPDDDQGGAPQPAEDDVEDQGGAPQPAEENVESDVEVIEMDTCTTSTNASDDYTHRGFRLQTMPFYVYRMYVTYTTMEAYHSLLSFLLDWGWS